MSTLMMITSNVATIYEWLCNTSSVLKYTIVLGKKNADLFVAKFASESQWIILLIFVTF